MRKYIKIIDILIITIFLILLKVPFTVAFFVAFIVFLGFYAFRVYDNENMINYNSNLIRNAIGTIIGYVGTLIFYFALENFINRYMLIYLFIFNTFALSLLHLIEYKIYTKHANIKKFLILGDSKGIENILSEIEKKTMNKIKFVDTEDYDNLLIVDPKIKRNGENVEYLPNLCEYYLKRIPIEVLSKFSEYYEVTLNNPLESPSKRIIDIIISVVLMILFSPFMLIISFFILIEDGLPIIFEQKRIGKDEKSFKMIKFRSLKEAKIDKNNPNGEIEKRVLKIGKFIRFTRLDESLQFINVLKGDMSIVGSRPEMEEFHLKMNGKIPFYSKRLKLKPGITGWAQINYKHTSTIKDYIKKTEYDLYYIKNRNLMLDLQIMLKTFETMIGMKGAR
ncbi:polyprenyl glycosylphosphotransferase [Tepiditoga spiralis]|uniref:Polyprenyl glycosylphosphotransferase n=1 Tax=Tepiditoga spiralis TaxID=2108365 RepID=A0A7G1G5X0_9BACT|nr:sugar transferase [Tepiditoga spiralis]BBE30183.1 polyprenyl glycosylphosphotransferase [Tepiditoga spiralis]